jgi:fido (protein-threonine AMPylation protein)
VRNFILEELSDALDDRSGQFRYFFRTATGRVEPYAADDPALLNASAGDDVIAVIPIPNADAYGIVADFIATLADGELEARLAAAASGSSPQVGRFLQVLSAYPRARRSWLAYRQRRLEQLSLEWLQAQGVDLAALGIGRPARTNERAAELLFDEDLEERLSALRERVLQFSGSAGAAAVRDACRPAQRVDEIYHSNAVRGNRLSRKETEELLVRGVCVGDLQLREHLEAVNLHRAIARSEVFASCDAPLNEAAVRELHALLFAAIDDEQAGTYRRIDTRLVGRDYLPPESVLVPALLREFAEWLEEADADPIVMATAAHAKILHLAPFLDGNGRVGRLVSNLILQRAGYPPAIVRVDDRRHYYEGLRAADAGDMSGLLELLISRVETELARWIESAREPR